MKKLLYTTVFLLLATALVAQNKLENAVYSLKNNELGKARELIDAASVDSLFSGMAATWYYRGSIYKEIFKQKEKENKVSPAREVAVESFEKAYEIEGTGKYAQSAIRNLNYLATTFYNHAAISFDPENYHLAIKNYERYKELKGKVDPQFDFTGNDIKFNLALATTYGQMAENSDGDTGNAFLERAKNLYLEVLQSDTDNVSANYNIGIIYYNQGVEIVNNMDYSMDLMQLNAVQDQIIVLFRKSLPYMKKAYDLNPKRKETLIGLQGIYFSLNDMQKSEAYKKELEALEESDKMKQEPEEEEGTDTNE